MNNRRVWLALGCLSGLSCASPSASTEEVERASAALGQKVDLLLVVDNSGTMLEEQSRLVEQVPHSTGVFCGTPSNQQSQINRR